MAKISITERGKACSCVMS